MTNWAAKLRRGEGPVWGRLNRTARTALGVHLPVNRLTRPLFRLLYRFHVGVREGWIWACRFFWNEPLFRSQCESVGGRLWMEKLPYIQGAGRIVIGDRVRLSGKSSIAFGRSDRGVPELLIGDGTFVGHGCGFHVARSVRVGRYCLLAGGVQVYDMDGHPLDADRRRAGDSTPPEGVRPVVIGDDVWVGTGALILKGVTVGDRAVIAARAVVTRDVPADSVVAGNPARVVRHLTEADRLSPKGLA
ncbi:MAG TPA: DapH/DapD/GlmU-related protein [Fimbriiglobus sp.]|nr:DapH/DapD/GlmU-related protein [Fimbriiglobus sp.]